MIKQLFLALALWVLSCPTLAQDKEPIKIGEIFCYTACPDTAKHWKRGWEMALEDINAEDGVLGRPLEVISRDSKASPPDTLQVMSEMVNLHETDLVIGTLYDHVALAAMEFAKRNEILLLRGFGGSGKMVWEEGHDLFFTTVAPSYVMAAFLAEKAAQTDVKRWAFISANYAFGRSMVEAFQKELKMRKPHVEFVETQWFPIGKLNAELVAKSVERSKPEGIYALVFEGDYAKLVRTGNKLGLFKDRVVINPVGGLPGYIRPLGDEAPDGWWSAEGYPAQQFEDPQHNAFIERYKNRYQEWPTIGTMHGYTSLSVAAQAINQAGTTDPHEVAEILRQSRFKTPDREITFRAVDGSADRGYYAGKTGLYDGLPTILDWEYVGPGPYLPSDEEIKAMREASR